MTSVTLVHVGDFRESYYREAEAEYLKRLQAFCRFKTVCVAEERIPDESDAVSVAKALKREAEKIRSAIPANAAVCAFCVEGKSMSSEGFAAWMEKTIPEGPLCFLIGSSHGLDEDLKKQCRLRLSMSEMTFPHRLARLMAEEQIYRAFTILTGKTYHK